MKIRLERVHYMPKELEPGVLYVSDEFDTAAHLCACGCGTKVRTPLGPTEWKFRETPNGPNLDPSVGNWQQPCQSHYWIKQGEIVWYPKWSDEEILAGRKFEQERRQAYYDTLDEIRGGWLRRLWNWLRGLFHKK
jgi:hypothetical protein